MNAARELFFQYDGSLFYMSRDGADRVYASYGIPRSTERQWLAELTARKLAALGSDGNWRVLNFLVGHRIDGHLDEVLAVKPLGKLWERTAFLEFLLAYVDVCRATADRETIDTAIEFVIAEGPTLLSACRADRTRATGGEGDRVRREPAMKFLFGRPRRNQHPRGDASSDSLALAITALADHFRDFGDRRAEPVANTLNGDRRDLPRRVLSLFGHGMGGLLDEPLYCQKPRALGERAEVDPVATRRRDELAETAFQLASEEIR
jgi:hypothetical protein